MVVVTVWTGWVGGEGRGKESASFTCGLQLVPMSFSAASTS